MLALWFPRFLPCVASETLAKESDLTDVLCKNMSTKGSEFTFAITDADGLEPNANQKFHFVIFAS